MASLLALGASALAGCVAPQASRDAGAPAGRVPVTVTSATGMPYTFADGAQARKQADAQCGKGGVRTSIYDRFDNGAWIYPEGCA